MAKQELTQERLKELLNYDSETGIFIWLERRGSTPKGSRAGAANTNGHIKIVVMGVAYLAHRLVWLYHSGMWPANEIDHVNGVRDDNRRCNLRECTHAENMQNRRTPSNNKSGHIGVSWSSAAGKWAARIQSSGKTYNIGVFSSVEDAASAYREAKAIMHTFNPVHQTSHMRNHDTTVRRM